MLKASLWICLLLAVVGNAPAQTFSFARLSSADPSALSQAMPSLARKVEEAYREQDRDKYLVNRMRLQMVAGEYRDAVATIHALRQLRGTQGSNPLYLQYEIFADAKARQASTGSSFEDAFRKAFRDIYGRLDDRAAARAQPSFGANMALAKSDLDKALQAQAGRDGIALADALELVRLYQFQQVFAAILPLMPELIAEDEARRYAIDQTVLIPTADGASIAALVVKPKSAVGKLPALLGFTIYANDDWSLADAKTAASYGYIGVVAYTRGKGRSSGPIVPYEHDGEDAAAVVGWIAGQPWSDGRVGMYGGSYNAFTQWAAAKHRPPALKAMMTSASAAPGIDAPMQGNIFQNFMYPWPFYTTVGKALDDATYGNQARWDALNRNWYGSGKAYRDMDAIDGTPNPVFRRWLQHPDYDAYWQRLIPYREEFAGIDIPVLATTGYFDGGRVGVLYYLQEHLRYNPRADHTLLIGPYSHFAMQTGVARTIEGYGIDPVAMIDLQALRYQWFDHVLKGGPKPELLKDRINYQVMGANEWKHARSIEGMANGKLRFYLQPGVQSGAHGLRETMPDAGASTSQRADFADRSDADWTGSPLSVNPTLDAHGGLVFVSEPIRQATEVSGLFSGNLDFVVNKRDMDITVILYEQMPEGGYFQLSHHLGRASYAKDRSRRELLRPGKRQRLAFRSERLIGRKLQAGSRLVVVLGVNKQPDMQINYGTGKDVSDETIADAQVPLQVRWYGDSYIDVPVWR